MKIKLTNILRGKERKKRKKEQIRKVKQICKDKYLYTLKSNCKWKIIVGKANKRIKVKKK